MVYLSPDAPEESRWLLGHYYGDIVRKLFLAGAVVMLLSIPLKHNVLSVYVFFAVISTLTLALLAGFTNPRQRWIAAADSIVAMIVFLLFEFSALQTFTAYGTSDINFFVQQLLALNFLVAFYFSIKTWRGMIVRPRV